jgi:hypothetical protein
MITTTPEYDKFKALQEAIDDANSRPATSAIDLEALVRADWKKNMDIDPTPRYALNTSIREQRKPLAPPRRKQWLNEVRRVQ